MCLELFSAPFFHREQVARRTEKKAASDACGAGATGDFLISGWADPGIMKTRLTIAVR